MKIDDLFVRRAEFIRAARGDLFDLALDLGFQVVTVVRCRLAAATAPERGRLGAKPAATWAANWLAARPLVIRSFGRDADGYWLVDVFDAATGEHLAPALVAAGHARPW